MFQGESRHNKPTQNVYRTLFSFTCPLQYVNQLTLQETEGQKCSIYFETPCSNLKKIRQVNRILQFHIRILDVFLAFLQTLGIREYISSRFIFGVSGIFLAHIQKANFAAALKQGIHLFLLLQKRFKTDLLFNWTRNLQGPNLD